MRRVVMIVALALAACPSATATRSPRTRAVIWHPTLGYVQDLCATGTFTASHDEAVVFASPAAAHDALVAADMDPDDFSIQGTP